ncbi:ly6/PLAUR domain-containing protein 3-like [Astyanax mexicanus]|uniref:Ly6/PLAUR domain-containing protein 3-like n=1 Tax=Astyanax mexicanus TaxID=7994 RepID=A0A8T2LIT3_ASTMX|nr:ly6/PLAUR domain-containing protein 3-like [Astyanax mexicanus]
MKRWITMLLICLIFLEALQVSEALRCYGCKFSPCTTIVDCLQTQIYCYTSAKQNEVTKKCADKMQCGLLINGTMPTCCTTDLCNEATEVQLGLFVMLGPLFSSILFL